MVSGSHGIGHRVSSVLRRQLIWSVVAFLLGMGVWPLLGFLQNRESISIEKMGTICDLQARKNDTYSQIVLLSEEYSVIAGTEGAYYDPESKLRIKQLNEQLRLLSGGFRAAEEYLAELQGREAEIVDLEFRNIGYPGIPGKPVLLGN